MAQKTNPEKLKKTDPFFTGLIVIFIASMVVFGAIIVIGLVL